MEAAPIQLQTDDGTHPAALTAAFAETDAGWKVQAASARTAFHFLKSIAFTNKFSLEA
jgi:hypothetical protein